MPSIHAMDIRAVDLNLLKAFDALMAERAVTGAAGHIGLSQQPRRGHPLTARPLTVEAHAALAHVLVSPRGDTAGAVDRALAAQGLKRRIALLVATYLALPAVLASSELVATVPQRTARHLTTAAGVAITPLPIDLSVTVSMAWHRRNRSDPAQTWFRSHLVAVAADRASDLRQ
jgi:DNA-binding transcriptional LysR family regulator